jgi:hypothetical protein
LPCSTSIFLDPVARRYLVNTRLGRMEHAMITDTMPSQWCRDLSPAPPAQGRNHPSREQWSRVERRWQIGMCAFTAAWRRAAVARQALELSHRRVPGRRPACYYHRAHTPDVNGVRTQKKGSGFQEAQQFACDSA